MTLVVILFVGVAGCLVLGFLAVYLVEDLLLPRVVAWFPGLHVQVALRLAGYITKDLAVRAVDILWRREPSAQPWAWTTPWLRNQGSAPLRRLAKYVSVLEAAEKTERNLRAILSSAGPHVSLYMRELCHILRTQSLYLRRCNCTAYAAYKLRASAWGRRRALFGVSKGGSGK